MKSILISISILIVCGLENIGHQFGLCFHGMLSQLAGCFAVLLISIGLYSKQLKVWLDSRNGKHQHKCKDHHHENQV